MQCALAAAAAGGPEVETALASALEKEQGGQHAAAVARGRRDDADEQDYEERGQGFEYECRR
ncbi:hypothetical protein [Streptomyces griseofuscus]|uniref:Uncharacterized protein n=1 Tax=Streptomyces griseofuscus TaxID=146922 RepID=A0A3R8WMS1_9ACTN|nr:hypothetical protein [Streptomyces griseofuscus]RRQ79137.1 hypothetical protein CQW44_34745 [Streptomyces griseofuscus]